MTAFAYVQPLPRSGRRDLSGTSRRRLSGNSALNTPPSATPTGVEPGQRTIRGFYRGTAADELAAELEELAEATSDGFGRIPVFDTENIDGLSDGYYTVESARSGPYEEQAAGSLHEYQLTLSSVGTRRTHWRGVTTSLNSKLQNDFGTVEEPYVGIDARADTSTVRWYDEQDSKQTEPAVSVNTISGEFADVELYDPSASQFADPTLIYSLPYERESDVDVVVWDDRGNATKVNANGNVQWKRIFSSSAEPSGALVLSNRIVRVTIDDEAGTVSAERSGYGGDSYGEGGYGTSYGWRDVALGTSDWQPVDADLVDFGPAAAQLQVLFENSSSDELYALDARLYRGWDNVLWTRPQNETDPTPAGLQTLLDPIASPRYEIPTPTATLVDRSGVRK